MKWFVGLFCVPLGLHAQSPDSLIAQLRTINAAVTSRPDGLPLSNRGMNVYLSNKIGYYLSGTNALTLYTNSVLANPTTGSLAINHNLHQSEGLDKPIRTFTSIGAEANATHGERRQFGFLLKRTWLSQPTIRYATRRQKTNMDSIRIRILNTLQREIETRSDDFDTAAVADYYYEFALRQSTALVNTQNYRTLKMHWTSAAIYIPLLNQHYTQKIDTLIRSAYPLAINLTHTQFWDDTKLGRLYLTIAGELTLANRFTSSITPTLHGQLVYFPPTSHFGLSGGIGQNLGSFHALNAYVGLPIVLIDKHGVPACNFEFRVRFFDLANSLPNYPDKTSVKVTIGVPFSKITF